jgi:hypothetical protein
MSITKKPLNPDDFPVNADGKKIKSRTAHLSRTRTIRLLLPMLPSALTKTKPGAKKISGQPDLDPRLGISASSQGGVRGLRTGGETLIEFLIRMAAVDMVRAAGFDVIEAQNADELSSSLRRASTSGSFSPIFSCRVPWMV